MTATRRPPHQVAVLAQPGVLALDYGIPVQAFGTWHDEPYRLMVCTEIPGPVPVECGPALLIELGLDVLGRADTIVVPGLARPGPPSAPVIAALTAAAAHRPRGGGGQPVRTGHGRGAAPQRRPGTVHRPPGPARARRRT